MSAIWVRPIVSSSWTTIGGYYIIFIHYYVIRVIIVPMVIMPSVRRQSATMLDNCGIKLVPILNVSPELVQAEADWHEWRQELHHALAVGLAAEMDATFLRGDATT